MTKSILAGAIAALVLTLGTAAAAAEKSAPAAAEATVAKLDLNRATIEELVGVPGIGPRMAQAIVDFRTSKGSFTSFDELLQVRGIKDKTLKAIAPYFTALTKPAATQPSR